MATNYHQIIYNLVLLKNELSRVKERRYQGLISELRMYAIDPNLEDNYLPTHKELGEKLNYKLPKICQLLKTLHKDLIDDFYSNPLKIKKVVHRIHIQLSFAELQKMRKEIRELYSQESTSVKLELPRTPSIGEEIELSFIEGLDQNNRGYVHSVVHEITGSSQVIHIKVHPFKNYYYKWVSLKDESERLRR